jgi:hypothetical protein
MKRASLIGAILGIVFTPIAVALALKSAQQGNFYWAGIFYPVLTIWLLKGAGPLVIPFALLQYPWFGWYAGRCLAREHYIRIAVVLLVLQIIPMLVAMFN